MSSIEKKREIKCYYCGKNSTNEEALFSDCRNHYHPICNDCKIRFPNYKKIRTIMIVKEEFQDEN